MHVISFTCEINLRISLQAKLEKLQNEIAQTSKKTGIASAAKLATISTKRDTVGTQLVVWLPYFTSVFFAKF